jgi:hypothetical protein
MPTWPASLPQSLHIGFRQKRQSGKVRSNPDHGAAKQRPRFTAIVKEYEDASVHMTGAQLATFETFYEDDLGMGSLSFDWKNPVTDDAATLRFTGEYEVTQIDAHQTPALRTYLVTLPLELIP